jgi:hypothetical protein
MYPRPPSGPVASKTTQVEDRAGLQHVDARTPVFKGPVAAGARSGRSGIPSTPLTCGNRRAVAHWVPTCPLTRASVARARNPPPGARRVPRHRGARARALAGQHTSRDDHLRGCVWSFSHRRPGATLRVTVSTMRL